MLFKGILKQSLAYLILATFIMLVYQYVIAISDPTKNTIQRGQNSFQVYYLILVMPTILT
jgi:hypothetical protein